MYLLWMEYIQCSLTPLFSPSGFYLLLCFGSLTCTHMYVMIWGRRYHVKNWTLNNTPLPSWNKNWGRGVLQPQMGFKHATSQSWAHCPHHLDTPPPVVSRLGLLCIFVCRKDRCWFTRSLISCVCVYRKDRCWFTRSLISCVCVYRKDRCWFTRSLCPVCVFVCTERTGAGSPDLYVLCVCLCVQKGRVLVHQIFDVLPSLNCWSPQDSLSIMRNPRAVTGLFGLGWRWGGVGGGGKGKDEDSI